MKESIPVEVRHCRNYKVLLPEEKRFCDLILRNEASSYAEAIVKAGIMEGDLRDSSFNKRAKSKATRLMGSRRCSEYIRANKKTAVIYTPNDLEILSTHMFEIAMGRATMTVNRIVDGQLVEVEEKPSFKDQIAAATWVKARTKEMIDGARLKRADLKSDEVIDAKAKAFLDKWKTRDIETKGPDDYKSGKRLNVAKAISDAEYEEALDADQSEYRL